MDSRRAAVSNERLAVTRRAIAAVGVVLLLVGSADLVETGRAGRAAHWWAVDLDINLVAARRLVDRQPLYDVAAARREGVRLYGDAMSRTGRGTFSSFIGPPTTALVHTPFLAFSGGTAVALFRLLAVLGMVGAVVLAAWSLRPPARAPAALLGVGVLLVGFPFVKTLVLGQGNQLVMLGVALGMWGAARDRWRVAGVGLGVATLLKVSPGLLLLYLVVRGHRKVLAPAIATAVAGLGAAAAVGRPGDLLVWLREVAPHVARGTLVVYNQSLPAWFARISAPGADLGGNLSLGAWSTVAWALAASALLLLWRSRRGRTVEPVEVGLVVLVVVLVGPLSWDHYATWAVVGLVPLLDVTRIAWLTPQQLISTSALLAFTLVLLNGAIQIPAQAVAGDWNVRLTSGPYVLAMALWFGLGTTLLRPAAPPTPVETEPLAGSSVATGLPSPVR